MSLNEAAITVLKRGLQREGALAKCDLKWMAGTWTEEEADEFDRIIEELFEQIDEEMWK